MTSRTHDVIAMASLLTMAIAFPPNNLNLSTLGVSLVSNMIGALIPDMDQATNRLWAIIPGGNNFARIWRHIFLRHRTITHSLLGIILMYKTLEFVLPKILNADYVNIQIVFVSIMIGYLSHLFADAFTKDGLPLFFPLAIKIGFPPIKSLRITTDSWVEKYLVFPAVIGYIFWIGVNNQEVIKQILRQVV